MWDGHPNSSRQDGSTLVLKMKPDHLLGGVGWNVSNDRPFLPFRTLRTEARGIRCHPYASLDGSDIL